MYTFSQAHVSNTAKGFVAVSAMMLSLSASLSAHAATPLSVTSQPSNTAVYEGQSQTFRIAATSGSAITYAWYLNGTKIGSNSSSLTLSNVTTSNGGTYSCSVTDGASTYTCTNFTLTVNKIVRITSQPSSLLVNEGTWQRIKVGVSGTAPLSFQWYKNGSVLKGAISNSITFKSVTASNVGSYYCVVKNPGSTATSSTASLKVMSVPQSYSMRLSWSQPAVREDGKALPASEISGYNLYYATSSTGTMSRIATLSAADLSYLATNLSAGTHYFAASTVDVNGMESSLSARIAQTIQ